MPKPFCTHCQNDKHWTNECPDLTPTRGTPRVVTRQILAPEHIYRIRPPLAPRTTETTGTASATSAINTGFNTKPAAHPLQSVDHPVTKPVTSHATVTECQRCVTLSRDIVTLERDATLYRNKIAALETELRIEQTKTRTKPKPLTPAERQRRARERKATRVHPTTIKP